MPTSPPPGPRSSTPLLQAALGRSAEDGYKTEVEAVHIQLQSIPIMPMLIFNVQIAPASVSFQKEDHDSVEQIICEAVAEESHAEMLRNIIEENSERLVATNPFLIPEQSGSQLPATSPSVPLGSSQHQYSVPCLAPSPSSN